MDKIMSLYPMNLYIYNLGGSVVKNSPAKQEIQVQSLGQEDSLEKEVAIHPMFLPGKSCGQGSLVGYSQGVAKSWTQLVTKQQLLKLA